MKYKLMIDGKEYVMAKGISIVENEASRYGDAGGSSTAFGVTANGGNEYTDYTGGSAGGQTRTSGSAGWVKINYDVHSTSTKIDKYALHIDL